MKARRNFLSAAVAVAVAGAAGCAGGGLVDGEDYARLRPAQPVATGDKIEVIEFFWYGCPHCFDMQPKLKAWARLQPADVALRYQAAVFRPTWEAGARVHHVLESLGETGRLADALFSAVQIGDLDLQDEAAWFDWAASQGLDRQRVIDTWRSPEAQRQVALAAELSERYQLRGVPAFVVDGKYLTSNSFTGSAEDTLLALDRLVAKAREERAQAAKAK
jgi:protein dithiol oxidoreductase (disulfide-forming)